jgi:hypothetical protein
MKIQHISIRTRQKETRWRLFNTGWGKGQGSAVEGDYTDLSTMHVKVQYQVKNPWLMIRHLNNKGQEWKTGHTKARALREEEGNWRK